MGLCVSFLSPHQHLRAQSLFGPLMVPLLGTGASCVGLSVCGGNVSKNELQPHLEGFGSIFTPFRVCGFTDSGFDGFCVICRVDVYAISLMTLTLFTKNP